MIFPEGPVETLAGGREAHPKLRVVGLTKVFVDEQGEEVIAVDRVNLDVYGGEMVTFLGPSGSGKTTILRMIAGLEDPNAGKVLLDSRDITHTLPNRRDLAFVFQDYALFPHMNVYENIVYGLEVKRVARQEMQRRARNVLALIGLEGMEHRRVTELSGGQQQRVALARAIVVEPEVLLFDEPLSNLDAKLRVQMRGELRKLQQRLSITSLYVTHDQEEAMSISDRIVVINQGRILQVGSAKDIYLRPRDRFVADFVGVSNFITMRIKRIEGEILELEALDFDMQLRLPKSQAILHDYNLQHNERVTIVVRPEAVLMRESKNKNSYDSVIGIVENYIYLGDRIRYDIKINDKFIKAVIYNPYFNNAIQKKNIPVEVRFISDLIAILPNS